MIDAIILSDLHLGAENCQARRLTQLLEEMETTRLVLNGDVFDSFDYRRLSKAHWRVLGLLRKLAKRIEVVWIAGNHDGSAEVVSHLLGVMVVDEFVLSSGGKHILCLHGHQFDSFLDKHPVVTWLADLGYNLLQKLDKTHWFARTAKQSSKTFLRCAEQVRLRAVEYANGRGCDLVCCGHTHAELALWPYYNSGCWTELPGSYLTVQEGVVQLVYFDEGSE